MHKKLPFLVLTPVLIWGLMFVGWGLDDLRGFFAHPARLGLFVVGWLGTAFLLLSGLAVDPFRTGSRPVGRQRWLMAVSVAVIVFLAWFLSYGDRRNLLVFADADPLRYAGLALHAAGAAIRVVGLRTLGKQFSGYVTLQENHRLVQTGIYGLVRHPMYLGGLLAFPGWTLVFRSWLTIPLTLLVGLFLAVRIRQEERLLAESFGAEFDAYRRRTWRLLPYLY